MDGCESRDVPDLGEAIRKVRYWSLVEGRKSSGVRT